MQESTPIYRRRRRYAPRILLCALAAAAVLFSTVFFASGAPEEAAELPITLLEFDERLAEGLTAAGLDCLAADYIDLGAQGRTAELWISGGQTVTLSLRGVRTEIDAVGETVGELLDRLDVEMDQDDLLIVGGAEHGADLRVYVVNRQVLRFTREETVPCAVTYTEDDALYVTQETVLQEGSDGIYQNVYEACTINSRYAYRTLLSTEIVAKAADRVIVRGTKELPALSPLSQSEDFPVEITEGEDGGGMITLLSGETHAYREALSVTAYAYTTENKTRTITATGTTARVGAIAVDPKVIPFGTKMFIQTAAGDIVYGVATAEDSGAFKGNIIDLFFDTRAQCISFGKRACTVYILE